MTIDRHFAVFNFVIRRSEQQSSKGDQKLLNPRIAPKMVLSTTIFEILTQPTEAY
jgi:hypothetical protein